VNNAAQSENVGTGVQPPVLQVAGLSVSGGIVVLVVVDVTVVVKVVVSVVVGIVVDVVLAVVVVATVAGGHVVRWQDAWL